MSDIEIALRDHILHLTLNRPAQGNSATDDMARSLTGALATAADHCKLVILAGAGEDFCQGRAGMGQPRGATPPEAYARRQASDVVFDCYEAFRRTPVPVIGVIRGLAAGFGCALAASCDVTLAARSARFQVPELAHNIMPTMVMSALLDRISAKRISYLVYSSAELSADAACEAGLVSTVIDDDKLDVAVDGLANAMLRAPGIALQGVKEYLRAAPDLPRRGAVDYARNLHATINSSSEMKRK